jgi:hypothetical protein
LGAELRGGAGPSEGPEYNGRRGEVMPGASGWGGSEALSVVVGGEE